MNKYHTPVLLKESVDGLNIAEQGIYVDVTFGGGGHSKEILSRMKKGRLIAFDQDIDATKNKIEDGRFNLINQNFKFMKNNLKLLQAFPVNGILADLGVSSHQFDSEYRGFSIRFDSKLDMRMSQDSSLTAEKILNTYEVEELSKVLSEYGELKSAWKASNLVAKHREEKKIKTVNQLKALLNPITPRGKENKFFAKIFQALRIEVNQEIETLKEFLTQAIDSLKSGGRLSVISYHSLEDRLVKNIIKTGNFDGKQEKDFYGNLIRPLKPLQSKPITPSDKEIAENNRARSAKLRIAEKL